MTVRPELVETAAVNPPSESRPLPSRLLVLCFSQTVGSIGLGAGAVAGPLLAATITGSAAYGPLPLGLLVTGAALSALIATRSMSRWGRAHGLAACYLTATAGATLVLTRGMTDLAALMVGSVLLGAGNTGVMLGRYAAADLVPADRRARATSLAVTAVTVGAVAGPALLSPAGSLATALGLPPVAGLYLLAVVAFPVAAIIGVCVDRVPRRTVEPIFSPRELLIPHDARTKPDRLRPFVILATANLTMVTVMGSMPNHLLHQGWDSSAIGVAIGLHVAVMFGPSPLTGELVRRIGYRLVSLLGCVMMILTMLLGAGPAGHSWHAGAVSNLGLLIALGFGWNLQLLGGSAWVIETTPRHLRHRVEGQGELVMGLAAAVGTLGFAGPLLNFGGITALCLVLAAINIAVAAGFVIDGRR